MTVLRPGCVSVFSCRSLNEFSRQLSQDSAISAFPLINVHLIQFLLFDSACFFVYSKQLNKISPFFHYFVRFEFLKRHGRLDCLASFCPREVEMIGSLPSLRRHVKNVACNYSDAQVKVREATSNDPWGPSSSLMSEIADMTFNAMAFSEIMQMIWKRLNDHGKNWRHVYKSLVLLDYLIKLGSEKVAQQCRENIYAIQTLKDFQYVEDNKDQGINVREKAKQLVSLLKDEERLKNERTRAQIARKRFTQNGMVCLFVCLFIYLFVSFLFLFSLETIFFLLTCDVIVALFFSPPGYDFDAYDTSASHCRVSKLLEMEQVDFRIHSFSVAPVFPTSFINRSIVKPCQYTHASRHLDSGLRGDSHLEECRPSSLGEEELQLRIALAISKEEAQKEENARRDDDARFQLALKQSQADANRDCHTSNQQQQQQQQPVSSIVGSVFTDLHLSLIEEEKVSRQALRKIFFLFIIITYLQMAQNLVLLLKCHISIKIVAIQQHVFTFIHSHASQLDDLLIWQQGSSTDMWSTADTPSKKDPWQASSSSDAWRQAQVVPGKAASDPWGANQPVKSDPLVDLITPAVSDPWSKSADVGSIAQNDPWAPLDQGVSQPTVSGGLMNNNSSRLIDVAQHSVNMTNSDFFESILQPTPAAGASAMPNGNTSTGNNVLGVNTSGTNNDSSNSKRTLRTPESFLGENSSLVNLDNLIGPAKPQVPGMPPSATSNPFLSGASNNPFMAQQRPVPTLNDMRSASSMANPVTAQGQSGSWALPQPLQPQRPSSTNPFL
ncbi:Epsin-2 [Trichinella patagoniensis]|uniref:Epsin-2 n=1 Tax=Trichinella patagoniensis TaxID=990121 RepID=A0A0V1ACJ3_9BILA|nr:Epsin-2 [Trichinella patagoniensis]